MGFPLEFNWVLKIAPKNGLPNRVTAGMEFPFQKDGYRVYPLHIPIDLINGNWEVLARGIVIECTQKEGKTSGIFQVIREYSPEEQIFLTAYWRERVEHTEGKINDFSTAHVS